MEWLWSFFFPYFCPYCKALIDQKCIFCTNCLDLFIPIATKTIPLTKKQSCTVFAVTDYSYPLKVLITKKHTKDLLASRQLAQLMWDYTDLSYCHFDIIVPVPLYWKRYAQRWFNQAQVMADQIGELSGKPVVNLLKKNTNTQSQSTLNRAQRLLNLEHSFELSMSTTKYSGKTILLIDDVMTTGTTLKTCAKVLLQIPNVKLFAGVACRKL